VSVTYDYPSAVAGGFRWNMIQRIEFEVGVVPESCWDSGGDVGLRTFVQFTAALTVPQKAVLDLLMAGTPAQPPIPTGTRFKVKDLWERRAELSVALGRTIRIYYSESTPGSGVFDEIELHISGAALTNAQKNTLRNTFAAFCREL
jgi:hypothetical protein